MLAEAEPREILLKTLNDGGILNFLNVFWFIIQSRE